MTTISVPLSAELLEAIDHLIVHGKASNKADAVRRAIRYYAEQQAVEDVIRASKEPRLKGNLHTLAKKI